MHVPLSCSLVDALAQLLKGCTRAIKCSQNATESIQLPVRHGNTASHMMSPTGGQAHRPEQRQTWSQRCGAAGGAALSRAFAARGSIQEAC